MTITKMYFVAPDDEEAKDFGKFALAGTISASLFHRIYMTADRTKLNGRVYSVNIEFEGEYEYTVDLKKKEETSNE